jgi:hypothetical protein
MHLYYLLDREESMDMVRDWLKYINLETKSLRDQITLTASDKALSFKLDIIANANGRVVYIADPVCEGFEDPIKERVQVLYRKYDELRYNFTHSGELKQKYRQALDEIRAKRGLPKLRAKELYDQRKDIEVLRKSLTDAGRIHDCTQDSETIMRCNIDGGDSDAYFYYIKYPQLVRNHKGEPALYMAKFDPGYYNNIALPASKELWEKDVQPFVFRNSYNDKYYVGLRLGTEITKQPHVIGSEAKIEDYFTQHGGVGVPSPIDTWEITFDPALDNQWNEDEKVFNTWRKSEYMRDNMFGYSQPPEIIERIIRHATGNDDEAYDRFINWLAYIFQTRKKTGIAWFLHGVQGTGKGLIVDHILMPILGKDYVVKQQARNLKAEFNGWMEKALIVNLDEFNIADTGGERGAVMQAMKMWITDSFLSIRAMHTESRMIQNYSNFILTTNTMGAISVDDGDRRMSFAVRQPDQLVITPDEVRKIKEELGHFAGYLRGFKADEVAATTCLKNTAKEAAKILGQSTIEDFIEAAKLGDLGYFLEGLDEKSRDFTLDAEFKLLMDRIISEVKAGEPSMFSAPQLLTLYKVICPDNTNMKASSFKKMMARMNYPIQRPRAEADEPRPRGWRIDWRPDTETLRDIGAHIRSVKSPEEIESDLQKEILASSPEEQ